MPRGKFSFVRLVKGFDAKVGKISGLSKPDRQGGGRTGYGRAGIWPENRLKKTVVFGFSPFGEAERPEKQVFFLIFAPIRKGREEVSGNGRRLPVPVVPMRNELKYRKTHEEIFEDIVAAHLRFAVHVVL